MHQRQMVPVRTAPVIPSRMVITDPQLSRTKRGRAKGGEYWARGLSPLAGLGKGAFHDGPSRPHLYGLGQMGQWAELIGAAAGAYGSSEGGESAPAGGPSQGGTTTGMQQPGSTATAVSPTFQTQISPQISPVFSQMQDSAGATQAATTTQYMPGGMSAEGGSATAQPAPMYPSMPPMPTYTPPSPSYFSGPVKGGGLPYTPLDPATLTHLPSAGKMIAEIRESAPFNWTPVYVIGGVAVAGTLAYMFLTRKKGR